MHGWNGRSAPWSTLLKVTKILSNRGTEISLLLARMRHLKQREGGINMFRFSKVKKGSNGKLIRHYWGPDMVSSQTFHFGMLKSEKLFPDLLQFKIFSWMCLYLLTATYKLMTDWNSPYIQSMCMGFPLCEFAYTQIDAKQWKLFLHPLQENVIFPFVCSLIDHSV